MALPQGWNSGGNALIAGASQRPNLEDIIDAQTGKSSLAALQAIGPLARLDGMSCRVTGGPAQGKWRWSAASTLAAGVLVVVPADNPIFGRWVREAGETIDLIYAFDFSMADANVIDTIPAGFRLGVQVPFWEVLASLTGGASSAIGVSSSNAGLNTKGDLLGGAAGDVAAALVSTGALAKGTVGSKIGKPPAVLVGGDTIRFDRVTSAFTAGNGNIHVPVDILLAP